MKSNIQCTTKNINYYIHKIIFGFIFIFNILFNHQLNHEDEILQISVT